MHRGKGSSRDTMKYLSLFSGIGGFELGIGEKGTCVGYSEIDKYARQIYEKHFPTHKWLGDIKGTKPTSPTAGTRTSFQTLTYWLAAFRARLFQSPESEAVSTTLAELSSLRSLESLKLSSLAFFCLRTSKGYSLTTKGELSEQSSIRLMSWGMTSNGRCLTARISESPRIGKRVFIVGNLRGTPRPQVFPISGNDNQDFQTGEVREIYEPFPQTHRLSDAFRIRGTDGYSATLKGEGGGMGAKTGLYTEVSWLLIGTTTQKSGIEKELPTARLARKDWAKFSRAANTRRRE